MHVSTGRVPSCSLFLASFLVLGACSNLKYVPGSGPPANDVQIMRMLSGNSFDTGSAGQIYQTVNGAVMSFYYEPEGPRVCNGKWWVEDSEEVNLLNCKWVKHGRLYSQRDIEIRYQIRISSAHGMDMIDDEGVYVGFLPNKYGTSFGASKHRGFPRWQEYRKLSEQLGL